MPNDDEISELKKEIHNLKERYSMLHRFVSSINEKVNKRLKKFEQLSAELIQSLELYPVEVVDITPEGFKTPTKKEDSSPVVSSSEIVKSPTLMPTRTMSNTPSTLREISKFHVRKRKRRRLGPTKSQLQKIVREMESEGY
ncbi:unnamed protein product [Hymenolepis diminuta]|uniref:Uncharacterized protein n=1 Tax=Hymenolepis diminuta TaxID=6216 RepID=A0A564YLR9_HYMDI|nr:unnamed protein product [Hymenolepis diminuta]